MQPFAPEFAQFWLKGQGAGADSVQADRDDDATAQRVALEELAERVTLPRSIT